MFAILSDIVGTVILHGKKKYWVRGGNFHYHCELHAGENTLEVQLARVLMRTSSAAAADGGAGSFSVDMDRWLAAYADFMQQPGSHNDTYASTCHRMFFANLARGRPLDQCADNDGHNTDAIDALTLIIPIIVNRAAATASDATSAATAGGLHSDVEGTCALANQLVATTRRSSQLGRYVSAYVWLLTAVLEGMDLRAAVEAVGHMMFGERFSVAARVQAAGQDPMVCYLPTCNIDIGIDIVIDTNLVDTASYGCEIV